MAVLFDKNGTLTKGNLSAAKFYPFTNGAASLVYHLTKTSTHLATKAITEHVYSLFPTSATVSKLGTITSIIDQCLETVLGQKTLECGVETSYHT